MTLDAPEFISRFLLHILRRNSDLVGIYHGQQGRCLYLAVSGFKNAYPGKPVPALEFEHRKGVNPG